MSIFESRAAGDGPMRVRATILVATFVLAAAGCGSSDEEAAAPAETVTVEKTETEKAPAPKPKPKAKKPPAEPESEGGGGGGVAVPNVVGKNHQLAQDTMQAAGFYALDEEDATGQGRLLLYDRNWVTVSQDPPAGTVASPDTTITLSAKKDGE